LLLAFLAVAAFLCFQLKNLTFSDPMESLYPEGHPFLPALKAINKMSPEPRMLIGILEVRDGDIYNQETISKIDHITRKLMGVEGVLPAGITSLTRGMDHYESRWEGMRIEPILGQPWPKSPEDFEALRQRVAVSPMGPGAYVSYDGTATMITAPLADVKKQAEQAFERLPEAEKEGQTRDEYAARKQTSFQKNLVKTVEDLKAAENDEGHTLHFMGPQLIEALMTAMGLSHISTAATCTFLVVLALLGLYFRSLQGVIVPVATMALSILMGMGLLAVTGTEMNLITVLFPLIPGLFSLAYSVLAVRRYGRLLEEKDDRAEAIAAAYGDPALIGSIAAAGLATSSLFLTCVPALKSLGLFGLFWLAAMLFVMFVFAPLLHSILPPLRIRQESSPEEKSSFSDVMTANRENGQKLVASLILVAILIAGAFSAGRLRVGDNVPGSSYLRPDHPRNQCFNLLAEKFMGPYQLLVYAKAVEQGGFLEPEALSELSRFSDYLKEACGARESIAFDMMVQLARKTFLDGNPRWQTVPVARDQVVRLAGMVMEQGGVESFMDKTFTEATLSPFFPESDTDRINQYTALIQDYIRRNPSDKVEYQAGGGLLGMIKAINDGTGDAYAKALAAASLVVFILGLLVSRSLLLGLSAAFALAAVQALLWIAMAASGAPISLPFVVAAVPCFGFGTLFAYPLIRHMAEERRNPAPSVAAGSNGWEEHTSGNLFLGLLLFAATVPWAFIGMKFQSIMVFTVGILSMVQAVFCTIFVPALAGWLKPRVPDGT